MLMLPATLTHEEASATLRMLSQALHVDTAEQIEVDAASLQQFDSSALAVLLECRRLSLTRGKTFSVRHAPHHLSVLAKLYGVDVLLPSTS